VVEGPAAPDGRPHRRFDERRRRNTWIPVGAAFVAALAGLVDLVSALTPELHERLHTLAMVVPGAVSRTATAATVVAGLLLLMLAKGLRRRKRRAWQAAVTLLAASVALHVVKGLDYEEASVAALLLVGLLVGHREFYAVGDPRTRLSAVGAFLGLFCASFVIGSALILSRPEAFVGNYGTADVLSQVLYGLVGATGPLRFAPGAEQFNDLLGDVLLGLGIVTGVVTAYLALRPPEPPGQLLPDDEERLRALLAKQGHRDSLGYFALRRDKSVVWSATGKAAIAYRVVSGVMLASGDPIGDPEAWPGAVTKFLEVADAHAWVPAVMGCSELGGEVWTRHGSLDALELGDEAVADVACFSLEGRAMRNVRQMVHRVERNGYACEVQRVGDMSADGLAHLRAQAAAWRGTETERGFSMALGRFGDPQDGDCVVVMARKDGVLRAFLHFVPWGDDGLSLDLMRRDRSAEPGLNELLIVAAMRAAPTLGVRRISLNFAVFRSALERGGRLGAGPVLRLWRSTLVFFSRWFQIESLYKFNAKFLPVWEPRFVCYPSLRDLPRIAIAALEAEAFIVWPRPAFRRLHRPLGVQRA
jgi:lysyl-tRNA synthetase class 2